MPRLTIGMASYNNYHEVWFTVQALRLYQDLTDTEILVVDNYGSESLKNFCNGWANDKVRYILAKDIQGTAYPRDKVFREAHGEWVICIDSHVLFANGAIAKFKEWTLQHPDCKDLIQGPMLYDDLRNKADAFNDEWRSQMWGTWRGMDANISDDAEPYEIPMMGLGMFGCRKDAWLGFNPAFRGFGAEEGYIHTKYRQAGHKTLLIPWLKWNHHFRDGSGKNPPAYQVLLQDKVRNYLIAFAELGLDNKIVYDHFGEESIKNLGIDMDDPALKKQEVIKPKILNTLLPKLSCVMTTYGRFTCVERSIAMFLAQDYQGLSELVILNTDIEHPLNLGKSLLGKNIRIINSDIDTETGVPYTNIGAIRRDAVKYASGQYYICWDDDDIFLPWNNRQGIEGILKTGKKAFKPEKSFFNRKENAELAKNTMEASVIVALDEVRNSFRLETGSEHLDWYMRLRDQKELDEHNSNSVPAYAFNWGDPAEIAGHKQSGDINNPNNFENHKRHSKDHATRPLELFELNGTYKRFYDLLKEKKQELNQEAFVEYAEKYL